MRWFVNAGAAGEHVLRKDLPIPVALDVRFGYHDVVEHRALGLAACALAAQTVCARPVVRRAAQLVRGWSRTGHDEKARRRIRRRGL